MAVNRPTFLQVQPIVRGDDFALSLNFGAAFMSKYVTPGSRLVAMFRMNVSDPTPLYTASTDDNSLQVTSTGFSIFGSEADSAQFTSTAILFDIAQTVGGTSTHIPGRWSWPVFLPVTRSIPASVSGSGANSARPSVATVDFGGFGTVTVDVMTGPVDRSYTDAQITSLTAQLNAAVDLLSPPSLDFSRAAMAGVAPYFARS